MNFYRYLREAVLTALKDLEREGAIPEGIDTSRISVDPPRDPSHGDVATNAAMVLSKAVGMKPRDLAEMLAERLGALDEIDTAEVAGPGFLNLRLAQSFWRARLGEVLKAGESYGDSHLGSGAKVNVEYVSANPTGPMHVGHGRGAVVGDVLARLLDKAGYRVTKEYYINDAGAQVDVLARSLHHRYREALGENLGDVPEGLYPGDYLIAVGKALAEKVDDKYQKADEAEWLADVRQYAIDAMMELIREDLAALGVEHDEFFSERSLVEAGGVDKVLETLTDRGLIYTGVLEPPKGKKPDDWEERPQTLFKASEYGDDVDRPIKKSDGSWTYFATDMAYHLNKYQRGYKTMIDVWGADHGGYVKRMDAAIKALTEGEGELDVKLCQMVSLLDNGEPVKMSKRSGTFVTLREVIDAVGKDVVRFIMLTRKNDAQLDFDLSKVKEQSRENPVFYVQYAHARAHSVMRHAAEQLPEIDQSGESLAQADLSLLSDETEIELIKSMATWPRLIEGAAEAHEPHRIAYYLYDLASLFHSLWNKGKDNADLRFLFADKPELTRARLALLKGTASVIASGLQVFGVTPVEEMR